MRIFAFLLLSMCAICTATSQVYKISLKREKLSNGRFVNEIIDVRTNKNSIGTVPRSNGDKPVDFKEPIKQELQTFFNANAIRIEGQVPLIVKIYEIWISERSFKGKEIAKAQILIEFIAKKEDEYYKLLDSRGIVEAYMVDVKAPHEPNLAKAFDQCFAILATIDI